MSNGTSINKKIEDAINSLDGLQRAEPRPFFYTRLSARLNRSSQSVWEKFSFLITKPAIAFAGILLIVIMNISAVYTNFKNAVIPDADQTELTATTTDDYSQTTTNFYDFENNKP